MIIHNTSDSIQRALLPFFKKNKSIGFVPTMGALHMGHISLVEKASIENDCVVVSIFVNPTQFNNSQDLEKYPRSFKDDVKILEDLKSNIFVFAPEVSNIYANKIISKKYRFSGLENKMEGKHRKGHFEGVGTVLNILFRIVKPNKAYFGEKDFQQLQVVKKLVEIEKLPVTIFGCSIIREENGLAMSSRNKLLTKIQFNEASLIYKTLSEVQQKFNVYSISKLNNIVKERFKNRNLLKLEYFEIANIKTLKTVKRKRNNNTYRAFIAVFLGKVRLIDNIMLN
ncbi:MAG: pantoate--beta-alanine ligase [Bacteroidetes bacterium]|nr:pantoate--beta-alanine ligase [Bacteroidota bacterium]